MDSSISSIVAAVVGAIIGGAIAIISGEITYRRQRRDNIEREQRENFKHKAELNTNEWFEARGNNIKMISVTCCSYEPSLVGGEIEINYSKEIVKSIRTSREIVYLENIGESDINEIEIATIDPKYYALFDERNTDNHIKNKTIKYGVDFNERVRPGEAIELTVYYSNKDRAIIEAGVGLMIFYRDSLGNICKQLLSTNSYRLHEVNRATYDEWRDYTNVSNNLNIWKKRLKNHSYNK